MNKQQRKIAGAAAALGLSVLASGANATQGYFQAGFDAVQKSFAGGGVADSETATSIAINPAGLFDVGQQANIGLTFLTVWPEYNATDTGFIAPGSANSNKNFYPLPFAAYSQPLDADNAIGLAIYGNGGMGTTYNVYNPNTKSGGVFGGGTTGVEVLQVFISPDYAHRFGNFSIGIAPVISLQRFDAWGLSALKADSESPQNVTNQGNNWSVGIGLRAGAQWTAAPGLRLAVAGVTPVVSTDFTSYRGLFANHGQFNSPATITAGLSYDVNQAVTANFDYKHIFYSGVGSVGNSGNIPPLLGSIGGPGFGWRDVNVFTISGEWRVAPTFTLRAGYAYNTQPIPSSAIVFNILAPAVVQNHISAGFSYNFLPHQSIDFGAIFAPRQTVSGTVPTSFGGGNVTLSLWEFEATVGYTYKFGAPAAPVVAKY
jgi:long-chain fatty acid transport protein